MGTSTSSLTSAAVRRGLWPPSSEHGVSGPTAPAPPRIHAAPTHTQEQSWRNLFRKKVFHFALRKKSSPAESVPQSRSKKRRRVRDVLGSNPIPEIFRRKSPFRDAKRKFAGKKIRNAATLKERLFSQAFVESVPTMFSEKINRSLAEFFFGTRSKKIFPLKEFKQKNSLSQPTGSTQVRTGAC